MTDEVVVVHRDRLYIPRHAVDVRALRALMEVPYQTKEHCHQSCPFARKPGRFCATCPGRDARIFLWSHVTTPAGARLVAVAGGDRRVLDRIVIGRYRIIDRRADVPFRTPLRWTGSLRRGETVRGRRTADQRGMLLAWRRSVASGQTGGTVISPPRSGKCVVPDTLVRTERGYHHIEALFAGRDGDVEEIGRFGRIDAPGGPRAVRGLYAQLVEQWVEIETSVGTVLGGSENHPVRTVDPEGLDLLEESDEDAQWTRLADVRIGDRLVTARHGADVVPHGQGLTPEQAALVGAVVRHADYARLCTGVLSLSSRVLHENPDIVLLLRAHARLHARDVVMAAMRRLPVLGAWSDLLLASRLDAWRAFALRVIAHTPLGTHAIVPDRLVARALHAYVLGAGVASRLVLDERHARHRVEILDHEAWDAYVAGEPQDADLDVVVTGVRRVLAPRRVLDVRVPDGAAFHTNGLVSHNTVIGVAATMSERQRTFITASKIDFLRQFGKRFGELTNLRELYGRGLRPVVLIDPKGWPDGPLHGVHVLKRWRPEVARADVVMSCFQQFLNTRGGQQRMQEYLLGRFGLATGDEIHQSAAPMFSRLMNRLDSRRKLGLTATISRKDKTQNVVLRTVGPVVAKGNAASDLPLIELWETGIGSGRKYSDWNSMTKYLVTLEEHHRAVIRQCFADLRENRRHCVLITTTRRAHITMLVKMINAQGEWCNQNRDESWPRELAISYFGGADTASVLNMAGSGRVRVVVAMVSMVQYGLDIARWTHVYIGAVPTSNVYNTYQLINRVCTPYPDELERRLGPKPQCVARVMIHALSSSVFCFAKLFKAPDFGLRAGLTGGNYFGVPLYRMSPDVLERASAISAMPRSYDPADVGVTITLGKTRTGKQRRKSSWQPKKGGTTQL